ncbi:MAG: hypothetical protein IJM88_03895 [Bacteroidales bacterium]|nr:hypothetical protein [Bacteroidales bacterium]
MKRILFFAIIMALSCATANAQLGGLLEKAAKKTSQKVTKKLTDKAEDAIDKAVDKKIDETLDKEKTSRNQSRSSEQALTYDNLMRQVPELPSVEQYLKYKEAELNEQSLKLLTSRVSSFNMELVGLMGQAAAGVGDSQIDSAQATDMAYRYAEMTTGLSKDEIEKLSQMSEEEQQAYLQAHYRQGTAEAAILREGEEAARLLEPVQPLINQWDEVGRKIDALYEEADDKCKSIYAKYTDKLKKAEGKARNKVLLEYYAEALPVQRRAVENAMRIRLDEQLPIAEEIERQMADIRAQHGNMLSSLLRYPQLTATQYFSDPSRLMEITEY